VVFVTVQTYAMVADYGRPLIHREAGRSTSRDILPPGRYQRVAIIMADLSSVPSFVRDTPDPEITRECLTAFCSKSRYQIVNGGGMLYQFVGDAVLGFFGIPESEPEMVTKALQVAKSILDIGASVSDNWQRQIDRVQPYVCKAIFRRWRRTNRN
jgi:class 3 adenylate cyclase